MPVRAPAPPSALLLPRPLRLPAAAARRSFGVSRLCRCPQPQRASEPAPSPADPAGTPPPPPPTPTPPPPTPLSGSATSDSFVDRHASVQQRNLPPVPQSREVSLGVPAGSEPRTQPSKCDAPSGPEPVPQSRQEGDSGSEAGRRPPCAVQPWWKSPPHVDKLVREFEERWVRTREEAFGITKEDEKRRVDERVKAKWENKVVSPHGDDVEKFFGFSNDWVTAAVKTSQPKENGVDPATNPMLFTLRVRPWDEIPRPNVKGERMGIVLNRDKDFRIFIVNAKSVFKGSYRRNFTRKLMRGLLEKYLPTHGRPGHDYHIIPQRECFYQAKEDLAEHLLQAMEVCHRKLRRFSCRADGPSADHFGNRYPRRPSAGNSRRPSTDYLRRPSADNSRRPSTDYLRRPAADSSRRPSADYVGRPATDYSRQPTADYPRRPPADNTRGLDTENADGPASDSPRRSGSNGGWQI